MLTISGAAGLGKTRLARETVNHDRAADDRRPRRAVRHRRRRTGRCATRCAASSGSSGAAPRRWRRRSSTRIDRLAPDLRPFAPLFGDVSHVELPSTPEVDAIVTEHRPNRTADLLSSSCSAASHRGPLIIGVEDAQWADEATAHLFGRIAAATIDRPWLVVVLRRDGEGGFVPAEVASGSTWRRSSDQRDPATSPSPRPRPPRCALTRSTASSTQAAGSPQFVEEWAQAAAARRLVRRRSRTRSTPSSRPRSTPCRRWPGGRWERRRARAQLPSRRARCRARRRGS